VSHQTPSGGQFAVDALLERDDVRYLRWEDTGLSVNRNHALRAATGEFCLIADDDLEFLPGWAETVRGAVSSREDAAFITFASLASDGRRRKPFAPEMRAHDRSSVFDVSSVEVVLRLAAVRASGIGFDERLGIGGRLAMGEEVLFLRHLLELGFSGWSSPTPIVRHRAITSTGERALAELSSPHVRAIGALQFCIRGARVIPWIPREAASLARSRRRWRRAPRLIWDLARGAAFAARTGICVAPLDQCRKAPALVGDKARTNPIATHRQADLIYDIGLHKGEDTAFYLAKGFRVVAIEADPDLVRLCRDRFREELSRGQLVLIEGAVAATDVGERQVIRFYRNEANSVWGTVRADWVERNARLGADSVAIEVPVVDLARVLCEHGMPHYMKIDIEGADMACLHVLKRFRDRPTFVSLESDKTSFSAIEREIQALVDLGYDAFQAVEQSTIPARQRPPRPAREGADVAHRFEDGASGLFGAELEGRWRSRRSVLRRYRAIRLGYLLLGNDGLLTGRSFRGARTLRAVMRRLLRLATGGAVPGWYDTHARLGRHQP
jgi:FkbM family methyltransferase